MSEFFATGTSLDQPWLIRELIMASRIRVVAPRSGRTCTEAMATSISSLVLGGTRLIPLQWLCVENLKARLPSSSLPLTINYFQAREIVEGGT